MSSTRRLEACRPSSRPWASPASAATAACVGPTASAGPGSGAGASAAATAAAMVSGFEPPLRTQRADPAQLRSAPGRREALAQRPPHAQLERLELALAHAVLHLGFFGGGRCCWAGWEQGRLGPPPTNPSNPRVPLAGALSRTHRKPMPVRAGQSSVIAAMGGRARPGGRNRPSTWPGQGNARLRRAWVPRRVRPACKILGMVRFRCRTAFPLSSAHLLVALHQALTYRGGEAISCATA